MELSPSDIDRNMRQFHVKAMQIISNMAKVGHNQYRRRRNRETSLSYLNQSDFNKLFVVDKYFSNRIFYVMGFEVVVQDDLLADALELLPEHRRNIILMKYFLRWSDVRIGKELNISTSTIQRQRTAILEMLAQILKEGKAYE